MSRSFVEKPNAPWCSGCTTADRDLILAKVATIDRCLIRITDVRSPRQPPLLPVDVDDIVLVNLQRAVQAAMDLATHVVATEGYGLPDSAGAAFALLQQNGVIGIDLADQLQRMVGFRNVAVHEYQSINLQIVEAIVENHLGDLRRFAAAIVDRFGLA